MSDLTRILLPICCTVIPILLITFYANRMDGLNGLRQNRQPELEYRDFAEFRNPGWLRSKELSELEAFDYRIAAVENNLKYEENPAEPLQSFRYINLIPKKRRRNKHAIFGSIEGANIKIFDETYPMERSEFTGIWIEFEHIKLPDFDILDGTIPDNLYPFDSMTKVDLSASPDWLDHRYQLLKRPTQPTSEIEHLLHQRTGLASLLDTSDFYLLTCRGNNLCLYTQSRLIASSEHIKQLKDLAIGLVTVFTIPTDRSTSPTEIEKLKRSEQEQNADD